MTRKKVKALVLAGFGINCDYESQFAFNQAGAETDLLHINRLIELTRDGGYLGQYHILIVDGGFAWADDHGAGVLLGLKLRAHLGEQIQEFVTAGKLVIGICNGFQALVNMGLLPGFEGDYQSRNVALLTNEIGNFRDDWVHLTVEQESPCVFTKGIKYIDLPIRHGEGRFYARPETIERLRTFNQVVLRYAAPSGPPPRRGSPHIRHQWEYAPAQGRFPYNPNGSLDDIAGICDGTGRVFGLMPHPEAFNHLTNHPQWTRLLDHKKRWGFELPSWEGDGLKMLRNAVEYVEENLL